MKKNCVKQLLIVMRVTIGQLVLAIIFMSVATAKEAHGQDILEQRTTFRIENETVKKVLKDISREAKVRFVYSSKAIDAEQKVSVMAENAPLNEVLDKILKPLHISYKVEGKQIVLTPSVVAVEMLNAKPQKPVVALTIKGHVTDEQGEPMIGASVVLEGTTKGNLTDANGNYALELTEKENI